jgi:hypothetical protein
MGRRGGQEALGGRRIVRNGTRKAWKCGFEHDEEMKRRNNVYCPRKVECRVIEDGLVMEMESRITYSFSFPARAGTKVPKRFLAIPSVHDADSFLACITIFSKRSLRCEECL